MYINKKTLFPHLFAHLQNYCKKSASDCSWSYIRPLQDLSFSCPTWLNTMNLTHNYLSVVFYSAKSNLHLLGPNFFLLITSIFFEFLQLSNPPCYVGEKNLSRQEFIFECFFIVQNPFQTISGHQEILKVSAVSIATRLYIRLLKFEPEFLISFEIFISKEIRIFADLNSCKGSELPNKHVADSLTTANQNVFSIGSSKTIFVFQNNEGYQKFLVFL